MMAYVAAIAVGWLVFNVAIALGMRWVNTERR